MTAKPETTKLEAKSRASKDIKFTENDVRGVVYGRKQDSIPIVTDRLDLQRIHDRLGYSVIFDLLIDGGSKPIPVLLHTLQHEPNTNKIIHFDLYAVTMDQKIKTEVPLHFEGEAPAGVDSDKTINTVLDKLEVEALPADLPENITLDISDLAEVGDSKHVSDVSVPSGVVILNEQEAAIIKVEEVQEIEEEEPEVEESEGSEENADADKANENSEGANSSDETNSESED